MYKFLIINFFRQQVKFLTFAPNWCPDVCRGEKGIWCKSRAVPATVSSFQLLFYNPLFRKIIGMGRKKKQNKSGNLPILEVQLPRRIETLKI